MALIPLHNLNNSYQTNKIFNNIHHSDLLTGVKQQEKLYNILLIVTADLMHLNGYEEVTLWITRSRLLLV
jgi:hypothetical protein